MSGKNSSCSSSEQIKTMKGSIELTSITKIYAVDIEVKDDMQGYLLSVTVTVTSDQNNGHTLYTTDVAEWQGLEKEDYPGNYIDIEEFACAEAKRLVYWHMSDTNLKVIGLDYSSGEERITKLI